MKSIFAIFLSVLFLLPSVGVHLDFTHCCGEIEGIGISHELNITVSECCDAEKTSSCEESEDFSQSPVYQDIATVEGFSSPSLLSFEKPKRTLLSFSYSTILKQQSKTRIVILPSPPQSLYQVFLC